MESSQTFEFCFTVASFQYHESNLVVAREHYCEWPPHPVGFRPLYWLWRVRYETHWLIEHAERGTFCEAYFDRISKNMFKKYLLQEQIRARDRPYTSAQPTNTVGFNNNYYLRNK